MRVVATALLCLSLAGCAGSPLGDTITGPDKLAQQDNAYCNSIGAQSGSPAYTQCRLQLTSQREASHEGYRNRAMVGLAIAAAANQPPRRPAVTCTTFQNMTTCQ
jgi:hypothetical protein